MKCIAKKLSGQPCRIHPGVGSKYCFFHDPALGNQRREAQSKGGSNRSRLEPIPVPPCDIDLKDPDKIADLGKLVVNRLLSGTMDPKAAYAIGYFLNLALRLIEVREHAEQIAQLDSQEFLAEWRRRYGVRLGEVAEEEIVKIFGAEKLASLYHRAMELKKKDSTTDAVSANQLAPDNTYSTKVTRLRLARKTNRASNPPAKTDTQEATSASQSATSRRR